MKKILVCAIAVTPDALLREINASEDEDLEVLLGTESLEQLKDTTAMISLRGLENYDRLIDDILDETTAKMSELSGAIYISTTRGYTLRFLRDEYRILGRGLTVPHSLMREHDELVGLYDDLLPTSLGLGTESS